MREKYVAWREEDNAVVGVWRQSRGSYKIRVGSRRGPGVKVAEEVSMEMSFRTSMEEVLEKLRGMGFVIEKTRSFRRVVN